MMGYYGYGSMGWIGMILSLVITVAVIIGLVVLVVWAVRRTGNNGAPIASGQTPKEIAQARYARGEINRDEYQQILSELGR